ncbi:MAG: hypothetical protein EOP48_17175 [Sphingobacteriales bacterium]|nr:MAG: hypothetical protein EOP48_17175 [Sphingobacteriales bacterium]
MIRPKLRIASVLITFCLSLWAIAARDQSYSPVLWILVAILIIVAFANDLTDTLHEYKRGNALIKGGIYPQLNMILEDGDLTIVKDSDCKILDVTVDKYPTHLRSTISNDQVIKLTGRYLLYEKIYEGNKYQYVSDVTYHSAKYLKLLLSSTQSFKLFVDKSDRKKYYFETPLIDNSVNSK